VRVGEFLTKLARVTYRYVSINFLQNLRRTFSKVWLDQTYKKFAQQVSAGCKREFWGWGAFEASAPPIVANP
jgi:hypothetical protein